jgi:predicted RecB family nuclease
VKITPVLFEAFVKCPTKCFLLSHEETGTGNSYAEWIKSRNESFRALGVRRLVATAGTDDLATAPLDTSNVKSAQWRFAIDFEASTTNFESRIHALERVGSAGRGKAAEFVPIRFTHANKLSSNDKLLVGFDALVLSEMLGRGGDLGKIIHGDNWTSQKVKTSALLNRARTLTTKIGGCISSNSPPDLILNRHCAECEFRDRCLRTATEKDDLSLLRGMGSEERKDYRQKGIFTVTQLSYTFRPRRRPKHLRDKPERYHHSLKALAIREKQIYVVGKQELKIEGTPVYFDVEALPDRDFYYLIGARVNTENGFNQYSFWADDETGVAGIWKDFLNLLGGLENPCLIHYGSFEKTFLKQMCARFGEPAPDARGAIRAIGTPLNLLSSIYARVYFPTFTNGLKDIARLLGFRWSDSDASGLHSLMWRRAWEDSKDPALKQRLITYNTEDCQALETVERTISGVVSRRDRLDSAVEGKGQVISTDDLKPPAVSRWKDFSSPVKELEFVTNAAHWDYQRDRVYVRSSKLIAETQRKAKVKAKRKIPLRVERSVLIEGSPECPRCGRKGSKQSVLRPGGVHEIIFGRFSLKRRVTMYECQIYRCRSCETTFGADERIHKTGRHTRYGRGLTAYLIYQMVELYIPSQVAAKSLGRLFGLSLNTGAINLLKERLADYYSETQQKILERILSGGLVHVDETFISIKGKRAYVWVFTNMHEVVYVYSETREGDLVQRILGKFKGVVVSDFYAVYDSLDCPQQKCLIHLIRDLNGVMLDNPYDEEVKHVVRSFGVLLKTIIEDVDRHGLKKHFLHKHLRAVNRFYREVVQKESESPAASTCKERFQKNRDKLFTFLNYDAVPWNNNNAEHAMKAVARLRDVLRGSSTEKGIKEYLTLLSLCQTCHYQGLDFLDFLRSGERDIEVFAARNMKRAHLPVGGDFQFHR